MVMKKPIIGVVPTLTYNVGPTIFDDQFKFVNSYTKKIKESGGRPIGLLAPDGRLDRDSLEICDGFLIPGGNMVRKYIYEILQYSIDKDLPILGICLGAQAMSIYSALLEKADNNKDLSYEEIKIIYAELKRENDNAVLKELPEGHIHSQYIERDIPSAKRHPIRIHNESLLYDIYQKQEMNVISFHSYDFKFLGSGFVAPAYANDGVKEAIEYHDPNRFALGVHFHPELEEDNKIFERLVNESQKRSR